MPEMTWATFPLGEVITLQRGFDITKADQRDGPFWVISSSGPKSTHERYMVNGPGVVIGRKKTLGSVYFSEAAFWPHDTTLWVRDFHGNDPNPSLSLGTATPNGINKLERHRGVYGTTFV